LVPLPPGAGWAAVEKFVDDTERAAQAVKEALDKRFGAPWNVVIGESYAFEITYEVKNLLYVFLGGTKGVLAWKSA
jgi:dynein light chain 4